MSQEVTLVTMFVCRVEKVVTFNENLIQQVSIYVDMLAKDGLCHFV